MSISDDLNDASLDIFTVPLNSINESWSICTLMLIRPVFDEISSMVIARLS